MQVVLYNENSPLHSTWSKQFVDDDKLNRKRVGMNGARSAVQLVKLISDAAKDAKGGGHLIFAAATAEHRRRRPTRAMPMEWSTSRRTRS